LLYWHQTLCKYKQDIVLPCFDKTDRSSLSALLSRLFRPLYVLCRFNSAVVRRLTASSVVIAVMFCSAVLWLKELIWLENVSSSLSVMIMIKYTYYMLLIILLKLNHGRIYSQTRNGTRTLLIIYCLGFVFRLHCRVLGCNQHKVIITCISL
jgi:hypothetical protein